MLNLEKISGLMHNCILRKKYAVFALIFALLTSCAPSSDTTFQFDATAAPPIATSTPYISRPEYKPGELVDYTVQTGDTIPGLARRFNTSEEEILAALKEFYVGKGRGKSR